MRHGTSLLTNEDYDKIKKPRECEAFFEKN